MLNVFFSAYPFTMRRFFICSRSLSTVSWLTDPASPCRLIWFNPCQVLTRANHPSLNANHSSSGMADKSANLFHFARRTSPVRRILSCMAFAIHRSIISVTCGCVVCRAHFAAPLAAPLHVSHSSLHFASNLR